MPIGKASSAPHGWQRFLSTKTRISMSRRLQPSHPRLAKWLSPEMDAPLPERARIAHELITEANGLADWLAPELSDPNAN